MLKRMLLLLLLPTFIITSTFAQEPPMSLLQVQNGEGTAKDEMTLSGESKADFTEKVRAIESDLLGAFMWYEGIILTADTEELGTKKHGTVYRVWTRVKYHKMIDYSTKLSKSLREASKKTLALKKDLMTAFADAEVYTGQLFEAYGTLVRIVSILTTFEHWVSCRRILYDNGDILAWKDSEPSFDLLGEYGLPCTRSFPKPSLSLAIPLDENAKKLLQNPLYKAARQTVACLRGSRESLDSFVRHSNTFGGRYGFLNIDELPQKLNFGKCSEEIYEDLARPAYYKFLHRFIEATAFISESTALLSLSHSFHSTGDEATLNYFKAMKDSWKKLTDWANDRSYKRGWSREFTVLPASFGTKDMAFPYGEITFNNLEVTDLSQKATD